MKKTLKRIASLFAVVLILKLAAFAQIKTGGYKAAKTDDARVVAAANFAVDKRVETNTEQEGLTLASIDKAETQVVAGTNFRLCLTVSIEDESQQIETIVFQDLKQNFSLKSWTVKDCAEKEAKNAVDANSRMMRNAGYTPASQTQTPACSGDRLKVTEADGDADMGGKRYANFVFTNTSSKPCSLSGFPKFALLDKAGKVLSAVGVKYDNDFPGGDTEENGKTTVMLETGKTAWFQVFYNDGMALDHKKPLPKSAQVRIKAPNDSRAFVLKSVIQTCCGVEVSSIRDGAPQ